MLCANQKQIQQSWPFLKEEKPVIVSWLPWSHTFGANHNFNLALCNGGSFYIDEGRPVPGLMEKSVRNLREVQPTMLFNVPRGFDMAAGAQYGYTLLWMVTLSTVMLIVLCACGQV
jgi:feruloyl-CoA synthase